MVVQHNMQAMNASRTLNITAGQAAKNTEKLSSGYKINRAADDAAGLSISEKMRKQIRGLDRASTNAQDGVSAVQTAEGALTEVHSMLQRMNELAVQASNGTNSESDRSAIQDEIDQLTTEIDRVAETTKFNETYLLKGNTAGTSSDVNVAAHDAGLAGKLTANGDGTSTFRLDKALENGSKVTIAGKEYTIGQGKSKDNYDSVANVGNKVLSAGDSVTVGTTTKTLTDNVSIASATTGTYANGDTVTTQDGKTYTYDDASSKWQLDGADADADGKAALTAAGNTITIAATNTSHTIVAALDKGEVSSFGLADTKASTVAGATSDGNTAITIAAGTSSVKVGGKEIAAVDANFTADSFSNIKEGIMGSAAGKTVTISDIKGANTATYTIVENSEDEDAEANKLTRENIISKIKEGDQVTYTDKADATQKATAAGVDTVKENTITADAAYKLMAEELTKASSIGTDDGKGAKVVDKGNGVFEIQQGKAEVKDALSFNLHVGADADMTNKINVDIDSMSAAGLGIKGLNVKDDTGIAATYAIDAIADAVSKVSSQRSALGADQNRLEHTIANVDNVVENTTSAESRIRDTDMAETMVEYSKNNILAQAGQSMLAQANQATQGVMSLLQ